MPEIKILKHERVNIRDLGLDEKWVHEQIAKDPSILGLGEDLELIRREHRQPGGGRLDLLLANRGDEPEEWYETEVQLGSTNGDHIMRCLEYWDNERADHPDCEHTAVLVAEDVTKRYFNVVQLFNRKIPLVAITMAAARVGDEVVLQFIKVLDVREQAGREERERASPQVGREYWEKKAGAESMKMVEALLQMFSELDGRVHPRYTQSYIVPEVGTDNKWSVWIHPKKKFLRVHVNFPDPETANEWKGKLTDGGLVVTGRRRPEALRIVLAPEAIERGVPALREMFKVATPGG